MARQNKDTKVSKFRLVLIEDQTHKQIWSFRFSKANFLVSAITICVCVTAAFYSIIAFTPVRTFIPGFPDADARRAAIQNAILADSLENKMKMWEIYAVNLRKVISGEEPMKIDSIISLGRTAGIAGSGFSESQDSLLRLQVMEEEQFVISGRKSRLLPIEGMIFFTPLKGVISQGYDNVVHPYIDITAPANSVVKAALDGSGKMGKSEGNCIYLIDEEKVIRKKVMKAVTDEGPKEPGSEMSEPIKNLFTILNLVSTPDTVEYFAGQYNNCSIRYGDLKKQLAEDILKYTLPIKERYNEIIKDEAYLRKVVASGEERARASASATLRQVREIMGIRKF